ncbi:hypothetical protein G210_3797 [Candida maltosa Xu316]|uniref:Uncharacterized protein n=1 Tax=Candida maltosa (strain Xu316) TaxID=1245528 RepID=M3J280_CANMX|nr:hypothetical protein G210_3797 [Candida maltosa Xu316]
MSGNTRGPNINWPIEEVMGVPSVGNRCLMKGQCNTDIDGD